MAIQRIEEGKPGDFSGLSDEELNERAVAVARQIVADARAATPPKRSGKTRGKPESGKLRSKSPVSQTE
jgi:hypothetical protein